MFTQNGRGDAKGGFGWDRLGWLTPQLLAIEIATKTWGSHHLKKTGSYEKLSQNGAPPPRLVFVKSLFRFFSPIFKGKFFLGIPFYLKGCFSVKQWGPLGHLDI